MATQNRQPRSLNDRQQRCKAQILTQLEPAKVRKTASAVVLKQGSLFLLTPEDGDVPGTLPYSFGLFYEECRLLDDYTLTLNGLPLLPLAAADTRGFETEQHLANPPLPLADGAPRPACPRGCGGRRFDGRARRGAGTEGLTRPATLGPSSGRGQEET